MQPIDIEVRHSNNGERWSYYATVYTVAEAKALVESLPGVGKIVAARIRS